MALDRPRPALLVAALAALAAVMAAAFAAIGPGGADRKLDMPVDPERHGGREADGQRRHGGGLQQPVHTALPQIGFMRRTLLA